MLSKASKEGKVKGVATTSGAGSVLVTLKRSALHAQHRHKMRAGRIENLKGILSIHRYFQVNNLAFYLSLCFMFLNNLH
jgi:hypothetical protein